MLWLLLVYVPLAHWVWGGGWLAKLGVMDFAGGIVVHVSAGVSALVCALVLGRRRGFPHTAMTPHSLPLTVAGAGMLWVGWFGFNAGSALAANGSAGMAMLTTHMGASAGALAWMFIEWKKYGKPSMLGVVTGMVAGLGTITPASGFVGPLGAVCIGLVAGTVCFFATQFLKRKLEIDDSLDVSPVHGVGGVVGTLLTGVFAAVCARRHRVSPCRQSIGAQVGVQALGVVAAAAWCALVTWGSSSCSMPSSASACRRREGNRRTGSRRAWRAGLLSLSSSFEEQPMPRAIRIHETGGPEVMRLEEVDVRAPARGRGAGPAHGHRPQLHRRLRSHRAVSAEHAGRAWARSRRRRHRDRQESARISRRRSRRLRDVAARDVLPISATFRPTRVVKIPAGVSDEQAAVLALKGMTACFLLRHCYPRERGDVIVVHAAAGGVGTLLSQWGKKLGAVVIGVVGSEEKAKLAKKNGCKHVLVRGRDEIAASVKKTQQGRRRARGVRRRGQGHLHRVARLPAQARNDGAVRQRLRARCRRSRRVSS